MNHGGWFGQRGSSSSLRQCERRSIHSSSGRIGTGLLRGVRTGASVGAETQAQAAQDGAEVAVVEIEGGGSSRRGRRSYGSGEGKTLRLAKLLADRAVGTRTEVHCAASHSTATVR